jgi:FtsK/SpoIIIE family
MAAKAQDRPTAALSLVALLVVLLGAAGILYLLGQVVSALGSVVVALAVIVLCVGWLRSLPRRSSQVIQEVFHLPEPPRFVRRSFRWHLHGVRSWVFKCPTSVTSSGFLQNLEAISEHLGVDPSFENVAPGRWRMTAGTRPIAEHLHFHGFHARHSPPKGQLVFPVGESRAGPQWADFAVIYNLLVGGARGGGKSAALRQELVWLLRHYGPDHLRVVLIDLAGGMEFNLFAGQPHLLAPVAVNLGDTLMALSVVKSEVKRRQDQLVEAGVTRIEEYNAKRPLVPMGRLLIVVDEWAQVAVSESAGKDDKELRSEITASVNSFARLGRKFGLHIVLATQRPDVQVVTGQTRANFDAVLAGFCSTPVQSRVLLGETNARAATLPRVPGRMIWQFAGREMQVQVPLLEPEQAAVVLSGSSAPRLGGQLSSSKLLDNLEQDEADRPPALTG